MPSTRQIPRLACAALGAILSIHLLGALGVLAMPQAVSTAMYHVLEVSAAGLCLLACGRAGDERAAWLVIASGLALWSSADLAYLALYGMNGTPPFPNVTDALYLGYYACFYVGVGILLFSRLRPPHRAIWLDGIVAGLTLAAFTAAFVFEPVLTSTDGDSLTVAVTLGYPVADLLLLSVVGVACALSGWRPDRTWTLIAASFTLTAVADAIYVYSASEQTYASGQITDTLWAASALAMALAAWQPRGRAPRAERALGTVLMPAVLALAALGLLICGWFVDLLPVAGILATLGLLAALARGGLTFTENRRLLHFSRDEALTDALTTLGNRRMLLRELEATLVAPARERTLVFFDLDGFKGYNDAFGHVAGDALLRRLGTRLAQSVVGVGSAYRLGGDEFCIMLDRPATAQDPIVAAAAEALEEHGEAFVIGTSYGLAQLPHEANTAEQAVRLADERMYSHKDSRRGAGKSQAYNVLVQVLVEREPELHEHLREVAVLARRTAIELGLSSEQLDEVVRAAELHDIGKIAVPDSILHKPGPLDDAEWEIMRGHAVVGERILATVPALRVVGALVRSSHESWDGRGYPDGLRATEIPLGSRIIAVCDAFEAMTSRRAYASPRSDEQALAELRRCAGRQFDADVVDAFCRARASERAHGDASPVIPA